MNGGLAQPDDNWAKHAGPISEGTGSATGVGGKTYSRLPGQCGVIAPGYWVRGHILEHHATIPPDLDILLLPTDRVHY